MNDTSTTMSWSPAELMARASVFATLARLLGPDTSALASVDALDELRGALAGSGASRCVTLLDRVRAAGSDAPVDDPAVLAGRWVRWFEHGRIPPYEGSNVASNVGGVTPRLSDIAGFYRSLGVRVRGERPDHVVAEFEFMALLLAREAGALEGDDREAAALCGDVARAFLRDHIGTWLEAWAARVGEQPDLAPWAPVAAVAAAFVQSEARRRNVVPLRSATVLADQYLPPTEDVDLPVCGDDDVFDV
jgi:nitrate reductase assembly molybdenum cofactor insertion protein NarJ